jgi:hypothetical protein
VYELQKQMKTSREKQLEAEGWVRKGNRLISPDQMRYLFDDGLEWDATAPGACGF